MHRGKMVALEKIVDVDLPVALHEVIVTLVKAHAGEIELGGLGREFAEGGGQRFRSGIEVNENQALPLGSLHGAQREIGMREITRPFHLRRVEQLPVERVSPAVIAAAKDLARSA